VTQTTTRATISTGTQSVIFPSVCLSLNRTERGGPPAINAGYSRRLANGGLLGWWRLSIRVEKNYEILGSALMALAHAREGAKAILEILASAEVRLATALANVEAEEDPRPRGQRF
jgi:hypothetical protein